MIANVQRALGLEVSKPADSPLGEQKDPAGSTNKGMPSAGETLEVKKISQPHAAIKPAREKGHGTQLLLSGDDLGGDFQGLQFDSSEEDGNSTNRRAKKKPSLTEQGPANIVLSSKSNVVRTEKPVKVVAF